ncbi:hypothetical protein Cs7R123_56900 [Catellatospora sp. TT07R-123]|nr:hypothetical protein Cs7R123_56900 [Catellatospora sp. TT07R-123]
MSSALSQAEAMVAAAACGKPVPIDSSRTEFSQVSATPEGLLRFESSPVPQRARRGAGWADVNLDLIESADGMVRPTVSVTDVAFSGGGTGPLTVLKRAGKTMTMSWPGGVLPAPSLSGDAATYTEVLPDVDLVVRATPAGFSHVLVVKSAAAAANPAVREVRFKLGGDAQVAAGPDGSLAAVAGGMLLARAEPASMWDSGSAASGDLLSGRGVVAVEGDVMVRQTDLDSSAVGPGGYASVADVAAEVTAQRELVLRPDSAMLDNPAVSFPIFVDPAWSVSKQKWAYATNNNTSNTDYTSARVGINPDTGTIFRSFFEFSTTANSVSLKGKYIYSARVEMLLDHSYSCGPTGAWMYATPAIDATMKATWSKMTLQTSLDYAAGNANEDGGCGALDPDMVMNFQGASVKTQVQTAANSNWNTITFGFSARASDGTGESDQQRWKRFDPTKAKLYVDYDSKPGVPANVQVAGVACPATGVLTIAKLNPAFTATFPDADTSDSLTGTFEWIEVPVGGIGTVTDTTPTRLTAPPALTGVTPNSAATTAAVTVVTGKTYALRAKTTDKAPYSQGSAWSPWCQFTADVTKPTITVTRTSTNDSPGKPATFLLTSNRNASTFKWGWGTASTALAPSPTDPKSATLTVTVPSFGRNKLYVAVLDTNLVQGDNAIEFMVDRASTPPVARWSLETYPDHTTDALADQQPGIGGNTALTATSVTWPSDLRMVGGQTATFNGSSSQAVTTGPVIDTTNSFSVAAWVRLAVLPSGSADLKVAGQDGTDAGGFVLGVRNSGSPLVPYWSFNMKDTSAQSSNTAVAISPVQITSSDVGKWVHLAGVYDKNSAKIRLYVNGQKVAEADRTATPWAATGRFTVGQAMSSGAAHNFWNGSIADVQVFDRVLVDDDFTGQTKADPDSAGFAEPGFLSPIEVGNWDLEAAVGCFMTDAVDTCEAPDTVTGWDRRLALSYGTMTGPGHSETSAYGLTLDSEFFDESTGTTYQTTEYGRSAYKTGTTSVNGYDQTTWQNTPVLRTDQSYTVAGWVTLSDTKLDQYQVLASQDGTTNGAFALYYAPENGGVWKMKMRPSATSTDDTNVTWMSVPADNPDKSWHHLALTVDVANRKAALYVDGTQVATTAMNAAWQPWQANSSFVLGRQLQAGVTGSWLTGGIDDIHTYQGVLSPAAVEQLYLNES